MLDFQSNEHPFLSKNMVNKLLIQNDSSVQKIKQKSVIDLYRLENKFLKNPHRKGFALHRYRRNYKRPHQTKDTDRRVITSDKTYYLDSKGVRIPSIRKIFGQSSIDYWDRESKRCKKSHWVIAKNDNR